MAKSQIENKNIEEVIRNLKKVVELAPGNIGAIYRLAVMRAKAKQYKQARADGEKVLAINKKHSGSILLIAKLDMQEKNYDFAMSGVNKLKKINPDLPIAWELEGDIFSAKKEFKRASSAYKKAFSKNKASNKLMLKFSSALKNAGNVDESVALLKKWLSKNEQDVVVHIALAQTYQASNRFTEALAVYEDVLKLDRNNLLALNNAAWIYAENSDVKAVEYASRAYERMPNSASLADTYAWSLLMTNRDIKKALRILKELYLKNSHVNEIGYHLGVAYLKNNMKAEAKNILKKLLNETISPELRKKIRNKIDLAEG